MTSVLIIVLGPPCAGKTTLARRIAQEFQLPLIAKDDIKESLFDSLGWRDREWSKKLGRATFAKADYANLFSKIATACSAQFPLAPYASAGVARRIARHEPTN